EEMAARRDSPRSVEDVAVGRDRTRRPVEVLDVDPPGAAVGAREGDPVAVGEPGGGRALDHRARGERARLAGAGRHELEHLGPVDLRAHGPPAVGWQRAHPALAEPDLAPAAEAAGGGPGRPRARL